MRAKSENTARMRGVPNASRKRIESRTVVALGGELAIYFHSIRAAHLSLPPALETKSRLLLQNPCAGHGAARSDAPQNRDRYRLRRSRVGGAPLRAAHASGTRHLVE